MPRCRAYLGLSPALPVVVEKSLSEWLKEILGEKVDRCPHCGAAGSLFKRAEFERLSWVVSLILSLFGQPTTVGVAG